MGRSLQSSRGAMKLGRRRRAVAAPAPPLSAISSRVRAHEAPEVRLDQKVPQSEARRALRRLAGTRDGHGHQAGRPSTISSRAARSSHSACVFSALSTAGAKARSTTRLTSPSRPCGSQHWPCSDWRRNRRLRVVSGLPDTGKSTLFEVLTSCFGDDFESSSGLRSSDAAKTTINYVFRYAMTTHRLVKLKEEQGFNFGAVREMLSGNDVTVKRNKNDTRGEKRGVTATLLVEVNDPSKVTLGSSLEGLAEKVLAIHLGPLSSDFESLGGDARSSPNEALRRFSFCSCWRWCPFRRWNALSRTSGERRNRSRIASASGGPVQSSRRRSQSS